MERESNFSLNCQLCSANLSLQGYSLEILQILFHKAPRVCAPDYFQLKGEGSWRCQTTKKHDISISHNPFFWVKPSQLINLCTSHTYHLSQLVKSTSLIMKNKPGSRRTWLYILFVMFIRTLWSNYNPRSKLTIFSVF